MTAVATTRQPQLTGSVTEERKYLRSEESIATLNDTQVMHSSNENSTSDKQMNQKPLVTAIASNIKTTRDDLLRSEDNDQSRLTTKLLDTGFHISYGAVCRENAAA